MKVLFHKIKTYEGQTVEVLVEGSSKNDETKLTGRTRNGKTCKL